MSTLGGCAEGGTKGELVNSMGSARAWGLDTPEWGSEWWPVPTMADCDRPRGDFLYCIPGDRRRRLLLSVRFDSALSKCRLLSKSPVVSKSSDWKKTGLEAPVLERLGGGSCCEGAGGALSFPVGGESCVRSKTSSERRVALDDAAAHVEDCFGGVVGRGARGGEELDSRSMTSATMVKEEVAHSRALVALLAGCEPSLHSQISTRRARWGRVETSSSRLGRSRHHVTSKRQATLEEPRGSTY